MRVVRVLEIRVQPLHMGTSQLLKSELTERRFDVDAYQRFAPLPRPLPDLDFDPRQSVIEVLSHRQGTRVEHQSTVCVRHNLT